jgi:hypothetical protein
VRVFVGIEQGPGYIVQLVDDLTSDLINIQLGYKSTLIDSFPNHPNFKHQADTKCIPQLVI